MKKWLFVTVSLLVVALLMGGCGQPTGIKSPRELTEEEKARVVEIALNTPQVSGWLEDEGEYQIAGLGWYAIDDGTWWCFDYEGIETDPNRQLVPESAKWYPGVTIAVGEEWITQAQVAVDLEAEKAVLVEGPYTSLSSPGRFREFIEADANMDKDKDAYLPGDDVVIELSFKNVRAEPFQVEPFPPQIEIMRPSPYDEPVRSFPAGARSKSLAPGEVIGYTITWDQRDDQGQQVAYGRYYLKLGKVRHDGGSMSLNFGRYVSLLILPTEGVIERTIEVNESLTVNNITFTMERVELTATEARFHASNTPPPDYRPKGPESLPPPQSYNTSAEYSLDGGPVKKAGTSGVHYLLNGMKHTWDMLDPVPKGTKEITFVITELGDWEGPWEFHVSLE